eukprot:TRINITY_DN13216_c0_g1_i4.p1 TRINITY_DN13216_c0_g1~~TRINITY_DN13216_c0_g1_i4.p1  ORF type:complete len:652 (-),score=166.73 TRINITY_DN13216_c0_g1_i4:204-2159(-)
MLRSLVGSEMCIRDRYKVVLPSGFQISLKETNLELAAEQKPPPVMKPNPTQGGRSQNPPTSTGNKDSIPWQTVFLVALGAWWVYTSSGSGGSGGSSAQLYHGEDTGFLKGEVREVATQLQFEQALRQHTDDTGLPVVVDFFSHSCGPCRMMEPAFRATAAEFAGRAVFLKVDVNTNHETAAMCGVRAMPTFQFFLDGVMEREFSGADKRGLHHYTETMVLRSQERGGLCPGKHLTEPILKEFLERHAPDKASSAATMADQYRGRCSKLLQELAAEHGEAPEPRVKPAASLSEESSGEGDQTAQLSGASDTELRQELVRRYEDSTLTSFKTDLDPETAGRVQKLVVIGGGPAGLSAALYAARAGLTPVVIAPQVGGQLLGKGVDVENYPGVATSTGRGIVAEMRHQASSLFNSQMVDDIVVQVDLSSSPFSLRLNQSSQLIWAHTLVIASGADSKWLQVDGEYEYRGAGVSSCATCDGFLYRDEQVLVIGGGDTAMEEALVLARICSKVVLVHRRSSFRAGKTLASRVLSHPRITVRWETVVKEFVGNGSHLTGVVLAGAHGATEQLEVRAAFVAIGHNPNTGIFSGKLEMDGQGYLQLQPKSTKTSVDGVFAAGDVADKVYRQAVTSAGTGAMAALDAERWLSEHGLGDSE